MRPRLIQSAALLFAVALPSHAQHQPADTIAGDWRSDAQFIVKTNSPSPAHYWVGTIDAQLTPTGKLTLRSLNGCTGTGLIHPSSTPRRSKEFRGSINLTGCKEPLLNRSYALQATEFSGHLKLTGRDIHQSGAKVISIADISTTLVKR